MAFAVATVATLAGAVVVAIATAFIVFLPRTVKHLPAVGIGKPYVLRWESCSRCSAGTQWLSPDSTWGPIPVHVRRMAAGGRYIEPPAANVRKCLDCNMGGWWRDEA